MQQACLHFAESLWTLSLQWCAHFLCPTPPLPGFAFGLHRRRTLIKSRFVHVARSSSAAQLTDSTNGGGNGGDGDGGDGDGGGGGGDGYTTTCDDDANQSEYGRDHLSSHRSDA